jgi:hypothetical protein
LHFLYNLNLQTLLESLLIYLKYHKQTQWANNAKATMKRLGNVTSLPVIILVCKNKRMSRKVIKMQASSKVNKRRQTDEMLWVKKVQVKVSWEKLFIFYNIAFALHECIYHVNIMCSYWVNDSNYQILRKTLNYFVTATNITAITQWWRNKLKKSKRFIYLFILRKNSYYNITLWT